MQTSQRALPCPQIENYQFYTLLYLPVQPAARALRSLTVLQLVATCLFGRRYHTLNPFISFIRRSHSSNLSRPFFYTIYSYIDQVDSSITIRIRKIEPYIRLTKINYIKGLNQYYLYFYQKLRSYLTKIQPIKQSLKPRISYR